MTAVRPQRLAELHGQSHLKKQIELAVKAAIERQEEVGHILLSGPSGCGKSTVANIIANERGVSCFSVIGTSIKTEDDLKEILAGQLNRDGYSETNPEPINPKDIKPTVLFIDEIHNLKRKVYETLYTVMEDRIYWEEETNAWSGRKKKQKAWVPKFTLIGATTREGSLEKPFFDRFRYHWRVSRYTETECMKFVMDTLKQNSIKVKDPTVIVDIAKRSRGTARVAIQLTQQCIDVAVARKSPYLEKAMVHEYFELAGIDQFGLTDIDRKILMLLNSTSKPVGVAAIAAFLEETKESLEQHYEPYLSAQGFIGRSPRGRAITEKGQEYLQYMNLSDRKDGRLYFGAAKYKFLNIPEGDKNGS